MQNSDRIRCIADRHREAFIRLADRVFDTPEVAYTGTESCATHTEVFAATGARISLNVVGIPTAVMGEWGSGGPVIAILGEYDALLELGQEPGVAEERPLGRADHGCGHTLLGSAALMAAVTLRDWPAETATAGRVRYYGCPAEEGGAAKTFMVRSGLFDDVDAAISWHPADYTGIFQAGSLTNTRIDFTFFGREAHAEGAPELGRSALDAVELMNVGVNYLREDMPPGARIHYVYLDAGGTVPNVVPARTTVRQLIRTRQLRDLNAPVERVRKIAEGAAMMNGTRVKARVVSAVSERVGNRVLKTVMQANPERLGPVAFDAANQPLAEAIRATLTEEPYRCPLPPDIGPPIPSRG